jgi:sn1-specific diacylglycerol lipase
MPFYVVADHKTGSIVVVIRGSISLRDVFTDLNAGAEKFEAEGLPPNGMVSVTLLIIVTRLMNKYSEGLW